MATAMVKSMAMAKATVIDTVMDMDLRPIIKKRNNKKKQILTLIKYGHK